MIVWVNKSKEVGDVGVQYDPVHASLPWAAVRAVLQALVNDSQTFGAMAEGVESVSSLITRYAIVEQLYIQKPSVAKDQLTQAIIKLYTAIMKYLCKAKTYYHKNSITRAAVSAVQTAEQGVDRYFKEIRVQQKNVDACTGLVEAEFLAITDDGVKNLQAGLSNLEYLYEHKGQERLQILLLNLDKPINRIATQLSDLHDKLEQWERLRIFE